MRFFLFLLSFLQTNVEFYFFLFYVMYFIGKPTEYFPSFWGWYSGKLDSSRLKAKSTISNWLTKRQSMSQSEPGWGRITTFLSSTWITCNSQWLSTWITCNWQWLNLTCETCNSDSSSRFDLHLIYKSKLRVWFKAESNSKELPWLGFLKE